MFFSLQQIQYYIQVCENVAATAKVTIMLTIVGTLVGVVLKSTSIVLGQCRMMLLNVADDHADDSDAVVDAFGVWVC